MRRRTNRFQVFGEGPDGFAKFERDTPMGAVDKALQLVHSGYRATYILGPDGQIYRTREFETLSRPH